MPNGGKQDSLNVQIALKIRRPPDKTVSKKVLDEIIQRVIRHQPLPKNVEVAGIFWQNPERKGSLANWRTHRGADLSKAPGPLATGYPRGSLREAIDTLAPLLYAGTITF